jgi:hypothetical protein
MLLLPLFLSLLPLNSSTYITATSATSEERPFVSSRLVCRCDYQHKIRKEFDDRAPAAAAVAVAVAAPPSALTPLSPSLLPVPAHHPSVRRLDRHVARLFRPRNRVRRR